MVREITIQNIEVEEELQKIVENLQRMTVGAPYISVDDLPRCYQHHTVGVSGHLGRLLYRLAHAVTCFHENED